jgi:hypothetical protein
MPCGVCGSDDGVAGVYCNGCLDLDRKIASQIFDLLVTQVAANEDDREAFLYAQAQGCVEWRFCGSLGFGGKFWNNGQRWYITCYQEDETSERRRVIMETNAALVALKAQIRTQQ